MNRITNAACFPALMMGLLFAATIIRDADAQVEIDFSQGAPNGWQTNVMGDVEPAGWTIQGGTARLEDGMLRLIGDGSQSSVWLESGVQNARSVRAEISANAAGALGLRLVGNGGPTLDFFPGGGLRLEDATGSLVNPRGPVVLQLDVFDRQARAWAWSAVDPPTSEIEPLVVKDLGPGNELFAAGVFGWDPSMMADVSIASVTFSGGHIAIPEPSGLCLNLVGLAGVVGLLRSRRRNGQVH